jgi:hypothetical protein
MRERCRQRGADTPRPSINRRANISPVNGAHEKRSAQDLSRWARVKIDAP